MFYLCNENLRIPSKFRTEGDYFHNLKDIFDLKDD